MPSRRAVWTPKDGRFVLAWNLRDKEPELYSRFRVRGEVTADLVFLVYDSYGQRPREVPATTAFSPGHSEDEFWRNFYAAVRAARWELAQASAIDLSKDEDMYPPFVMRLV